MPFNEMLIWNFKTCLVDQIKFPPFYNGVDKISGTGIKSKGDKKFGGLYELIWQKKNRELN